MHITLLECGLCHNLASRMQFIHIYLLYFTNRHLYSPYDGLIPAETEDVPLGGDRGALMSTARCIERVGNSAPIEVYPNRNFMRHILESQSKGDIS